MFEPKYKPNVTADEIIRDGWARELQVGQTLEELKAMNLSASIETVITAWVKLDKEMEAFYKFWNQK